MRILKHFYLIVTFFLLHLQNALAMEETDVTEFDVFDWNDFDLALCLKGTLIALIFLISGFYMRSRSSTMWIRMAGLILIILGGVTAFCFLGGPVIGIIATYWQILLGISILLGIIYWLKAEFLESKQ